MLYASRLSTTPTLIVCRLYHTNMKLNPVDSGADVELSTPQKLEWGAATAVEIAEANQSGLS